MRPLHTAILVASLVTSTAACSSDARCSIDQDCFAGESCVDAICTVVADTGDTGTSASDTAQPGDVASTADTHTASDMATTTPDATQVERDLGGAADVAPVEDAGAEVDMSPGGTCTIDPFDFTCSDDAFEPNNTWIDGDRLVVDTLGCNPDFVPHDSSYLATMCPLDGSDWYYVNFYPCSDGSSYVLQWQVQLESDCDADVIAFEPLSYKCDESFVDCTTIDGKPTIRMIVDNTKFQNLQSTYVQVHNKDQDDVTFDYRISVSVRR